MSVESKERRKALQLFGATSLFALAGGARSQQLCRNGGESTAGPYPDTVLRNLHLYENGATDRPPPIDELHSITAGVRQAVLDIAAFIERYP